MDEWIGNNREDTIEREIAELFAEYDNGLYISVDQAEFTAGFNNLSLYGKQEQRLLGSISEVLCAWYADENMQYKNVDDFLKRNKIDSFLTRRDFISVINGHDLLPMSFLPLMKEKLPFNVGLKKLVELNRQNYLDNRWLKPLSMDSERIYAELKRIDRQKKEAIRAQRKVYEQEHAEKIRAYKQEYYLKHKQEIMERNRLFYRANPQKRKDILQKYRLKHPAEITEIKKRYYERHKEELLAKAKAWRAENPDRVKETSQRNYAENREKRRAQNKEWIKNNPEARKAQKAKYQAAHAKEIAAKEAIRRNKKRFKNKTGIKILALLQGIVAARS